MIRISIFILLMLAASCRTTKVNTGMIHRQAPVIIYTTTTDLFDRVPVTMNSEKDRIVSFPAPSDLYYQGELALPVRLKKGYLLDRRGINANSVFTSYTYREYAGLKSPPSLDDLMKSITHPEPFESMYNCGTKSDFQDLVDELNGAIEGGLAGFEPMIR